MDDLWGDDDLDADVVEECLLATQASFSTSSSTHQQQNDYSSFPSQSDVRESTRFEFKQPAVRNSFQAENKPLPTSVHKQSKPNQSWNASNASSASSGSSSYLQEIEKLKEENKKLSEANLVKTGESSILRADIQNLRMTLEKREAESNQQIGMLQKKIQQMDSQHQKQLESSKTELKFKEMELEELKNKCKRIEQTGKETPRIGRQGLPPNSPLISSRMFHPNRSVFESSERKGVFIDANVQTDPCRQTRVVVSDEHIDSAPSVEVLAETLRFLLLSQNESPDSFARHLEQLRIQIVTTYDREHLTACLHSSKPCVIELLLNNLEHIKAPEELRYHLDFLVSWISKVLPLLEAHHQVNLLKILLAEIRRLSFIHVMQLCSAIVVHLGLETICKSNSGCLLERAALQLKEAYPALIPEDQFQATKQLVLTLSAILASPPSESLKKCACIPHLLKTLVVVVQHQIALEGLTPYAADRRLKVLVHAFRLCQSILSSKVEPWLTFLQSPAEVNRIFTVLTAISLEFPIPRELIHEINVGAFVGP